MIVDLKDNINGTHQSPITLSVDLLPFNFHPSSAIHQVTKYIHECLLYDHLSAYHRLGVPSKRWERPLRFLSLWVVSACCSCQEEIEFTRGVLYRAEWQVRPRKPAQ